MTHPDQTLGTGSESPSTLHRLSVEAIRQGDHLSAINLLTKLIKVHAIRPEYLIDLGNAFRALGQHKKSIVSYRAALQLAPQSSAIMNNLALVLSECGELNQALSLYKQALMLSPKSVEVLTNYSNLLRDCGEVKNSLIAAAEALSVSPAHLPALISLGMSYCEMADFKRAEDAYRKALAVDPLSAIALDNLGVLHQELGLFDQARNFHDQAISISPAFADAHVNLATALLSLGEFSSGWKEYEWRFRCKRMSSQLRNFKGKRWHAETLTGRRLVVWGEQGIGDEIMFAALLPLLEGLGGEVTLECDPRLVTLFKRSFPWIDVVAKADRNLSGQFDYNIPIGSLASLFWKNFAESKRISYLKTDQDLTNRLRASYRSAFPGKKIYGLSWKSFGGGLARSRSIRLSELTPLLEDPGSVFVSLQYGSIEEELRDLPEAVAKKIFIDTDIDPKTDLDRLASQCLALDGVLTIDNVTAHLAGALGVSTTTILPATPDWRWGDSARTLIYPKMKVCEITKLLSSAREEGLSALLAPKDLLSAPAE